MMVKEVDMRKNPVSRNKLSKKHKRALDRERRVTWAFSPVSRGKQSKKTYRRARRKPLADEERHQA